MQQCSRLRHSADAYTACCGSLSYVLRKLACQKQTRGICKIRYLICIIQLLPAVPSYQTVLDRVLASPNILPGRKADSSKTTVHTVNNISIIQTPAYLDSSKEIAKGLRTNLKNHFINR